MRIDYCMPEISKMLKYAAKNQWSLVREIMKKGNTDFDVAYTSGFNKGISVLWYTAAAKQWILVNKMILRGARNFAAHPENNNHLFSGVTVLWMAIQHKDQIIIKRMLKHKPEQCFSITPNNHLSLDNGITCLLLAASLELWDIVKLMLAAGDTSFNDTPLNPRHRLAGANALWLTAYANKWDLFEMMYKLAKDFTVAPINDSVNYNISLIDLLIGANRISIINYCNLHNKFKHLSTDKKNLIKNKLLELEQALHFVCQAGIYSDELVNNNNPVDYNSLPYEIKHKISILLLKQNFSNVFKNWPRQTIATALNTYYHQKYTPARCNLERASISARVMYNLRNQASMHNANPMLFYKLFVQHKKLQIENTIVKFQHQQKLPKYLSQEIRQKITTELSNCDLSQTGIEQSIAKCLAMDDKPLFKPNN